MKRIILVLILAVVGALSIGVPSASAVGSCSNFVQTGPIIGGGIDMGWAATCNVQFGVQIVPQYESGGTWHRATKSGNPAGATQGPFSAGSHSSDFKFTGIDQTPYCAFNWRASTGVFNHATGDNIAGGIGPTLHKTC